MKIGKERFEDHCWKDVVPPEDIKLYETYVRETYIGPNAAVARTLGGGSATVFPPYTVSPLDGIRAALGDINITIGGEMEVRKAPGDQARLFGTVQTVRGTYEFQGRRFNLDRGGRIRFVGDTEINPFLDISATRVIPNTGVEARVRIQGTARAPQLALTSNPPLEESDILALIVFNRPVNELGTGERASLATTAGGIATGQPIRLRVAFKPTSSILTPVETISPTGEAATIATKGRHDPCVGIRGVPVVEAMVALVLADQALLHRGQCG